MKKNLVKILGLVLVLVVAVSCLVAFTACNTNPESQKTKIAAQSGTSGFFYIKGGALGYDGFENLEAKGYKKYALACTDLINGNVKALIADNAPADSLVENMKGIKKVPIKLTQENFAFAFDKGDDKIKNEFNQWMKTNNTKVQTIINSYLDGTNTYEGVLEGSVDSSKKQLVVATEAGFEPFEYKAGKKFKGIDIQLCDEFAKDNGYELVIKNMDFEAVLTAMGVDGVNILAAGLTVDAEREKTMNFSDPYFETQLVLLVKADDTTFDACKTVEDVVAKLKSL